MPDVDVSRERTQPKRKADLSTEERRKVFGPRDSSLPEAWYLLAFECGGIEGLASELGVSRRTIHHWAQEGGTITESAAKLIRMITAAKNVQSPV